MYTHELTEIEEACGVTLDDVEELLPKVLKIAGWIDGEPGHTKVIVPADTPPALGSSVARAAFGAPAEFAGMNQLGQPVYRKTL